jgi:hypothetical protein
MICGTALIYGHEVRLTFGEQGYDWECDHPGILAAARAAAPVSEVTHSEGHPAAALLDRIEQEFNCQVRRSIPPASEAEPS